MKITISIVFLLAAFASFSQDLIIFKSGDEIQSKVLEITETAVKYKKFANQSGPTYTTSKKDVFMIKYKNGDKDVFKDTPVSSSKEGSVASVDSYNQSDKFTYDKTIGQLGCMQKKRVGAKIYGSRSNEVFNAGNIVYYGIDISYSKLTSVRELGKGEELLSKYAFQMRSLVNKDFLKIYDLRRWMKKTNMFYGTDIFSNYSQMDYSAFVTEENYCLSFSDINKIIKGYVLNEKEGIGMVVNVANFNKTREYVGLFVTFFDISSREVLYSVEATGEAGGAGWGKHYSVGIGNAVRKMFIDEIYKRKYSSSAQIHPKLLLE